MITPETATKLKELGFPLVSVGKEDHAYAAEFCRFCGFPFLKVGDTYYLMPVINALLPAFGDAPVEMHHEVNGENRFMAKLSDSNRVICYAVDADEAIASLWVHLKEANEIKLEN
jgi:hypothetical protein